MTQGRWSSGMVQQLCHSTQAKWYNMPMPGTHVTQPSVHKTSAQKPFIEQNTPHTNKCTLYDIETWAIMTLNVIKNFILNQICLSIWPIKVNQVTVWSGRGRRHLPLQNWWDLWWPTKCITGHLVNDQEDNSVICNQAMASSSAAAVTASWTVCVQQFWTHHSWEQLHMWHVYWHTSLIYAHQVLQASRIFVTFEWPICCLHIFCSNMVAVYWFMMDICNQVGSM